MKRWLLMSSLLVLAACSAEPAAYLIAGTDVSLTVERIKDNFWTRNWRLSLVVRHNPDCQRRYQLKPAGQVVKVDVYRPQEGVYILQQGKRWYVTELKTCRFDTFQEPPPEPGDLMGSFEEKDGVFMFVANTEKPARAE
jgi:hypothetical protein